MPFDCDCTGEEGNFYPFFGIEKGEIDFCKAREKGGGGGGTNNADLCMYVYIYMHVRYCCYAQTLRTQENKARTSSSGGGGHASPILSKQVNSGVGRKRIGGRGHKRHYLSIWLRYRSVIKLERVCGARTCGLVIVADGYLVELYVSKSCRICVRVGRCAHFSSPRPALVRCVHCLRISSHADRTGSELVTVGGEGEGGG